MQFCVASDVHEPKQRQQERKSDIGVKEPSTRKVHHSHILTQNRYGTVSIVNNDSRRKRHHVHDQVFSCCIASYIGKSLRDLCVLEYGIQVESKLDNLFRDFRRVVNYSESESLAEINVAAIFVALRRWVPTDVVRNRYYVNVDRPIS